VITSATCTLAYSPCPNDTYIFAALALGLLDDVPPVRVALHDIDALNEAAALGEYELVKVSYGAIPHLMDKYRILRAGGALGRGCGPLIVVRESVPADLTGLEGKRIAVPGYRTTAHLLMRLALHGYDIVSQDTVVMRFDEILAAVANGDVDAGLIIHESRFTYERYGLRPVIDLGAWWESLTRLPIPLGAILVHESISAERSLELNDAIRRSLAYARQHDDEVMAYVHRHASEMDEEVMRKHVALYVNEFSDDIGDEGLAAVRELFARAAAAGLAPATVKARFIEKQMHAS
jgi:1,4-dihydroxy-6-naphthoate synthase